MERNERVKRNISTSEIAGKYVGRSLCRRRGGKQHPTIASSQIIQTRHYLWIDFIGRRPPVLNLNKVRSTIPGLGWRPGAQALKFMAVHPFGVAGDRRGVAFVMFLPLLYLQHFYPALFPRDIPHGSLVSSSLRMHMLGPQMVQRTYSHQCDKYPAQ